MQLMDLPQLVLREIAGECDNKTRQNMRAVGDASLRNAVDEASTALFVKMGAWHSSDASEECGRMVHLFGCCPRLTELHMAKSGVISSDFKVADVYPALHGLAKKKIR